MRLSGLNVAVCLSLGVALGGCHSSEGPPARAATSPGHDRPHFWIATSSGTDAAFTFSNIVMTAAVETASSLALRR